MLLFVPPSMQKKLKERLKKLIYVPFKFEFSGSQIIFFDVEEDYSAEEIARASQPIQAFQELTDDQMARRVEHEFNPKDIGSPVS